MVTEGKRVKTNLTVTVWRNCSVGYELCPLPPPPLRVYQESEIKPINFNEKLINKSSPLMVEVVYPCRQRLWTVLALLRYFLLSILTGQLNK